MMDLVTTKDPVLKRIDPVLRREYTDAVRAHELAVSSGVREYERSAFDALMRVEARFLDAAILAANQNSHANRKRKAEAVR